MKILKTIIGLDKAISLTKFDIEALYISIVRYFLFSVIYLIELFYSK